MRTIEHPEHIKCHRQRHAWYNDRRTKLKHRIEHAKRAEQLWPSTTRHHELTQLEHELERLNITQPESANIFF